MSYSSWKLVPQSVAFTTFSGASHRSVSAKAPSAPSIGKHWPQSVSVCRLCVGANYIITWKCYIHKYSIFLICIFIHGAGEIKFSKQNENSAAFIHSIKCRMTNAFSYKIKRGHQCRRCVYCFNCYLHAFAHWIIAAEMPWRSPTIYYFFSFSLGVLCARQTIQTPRISDERLFSCFAGVFIVAMRLFSRLLFYCFLFLHAIAFERVLFLIQEKKTIVRDWVCSRNKKSRPVPDRMVKLRKTLYSRAQRLRPSYICCCRLWKRMRVEQREWKIHYWRLVCSHSQNNLCL